MQINFITKCTTDQPKKNWQNFFALESGNNRIKIPDLLLKMFKE
jgi:hypothetical protein